VTTFGQRVLLPAGVTWTVLGADGLPHESYERFLAHHRIVSAPNTVRAHATSLGCFELFLQQTGLVWDQIGRDDLANFVHWLRFGTTRVFST
jgi:hypothetical protein